MSVVYLAAILLSLICMGLVDHRWRLFLFDRPRRAATVVACGVVFFLLWDVAAIALGVYVRGDSSAMTGLQVTGQLPVEEVFFVAFLCYVTMVVHRLVRQVLTAR